MSEIDDLKFTNNWTNNLLEELDSLRKQDCTSIDIETAIGRCSMVCFKANHFDEKLKNFKGLDDFLKFCETDLGWELDYDKHSGVIMCYEHNESCLCPIVRVDHNNVSDAMCCCTQGEIKRMFEYAINQLVDVEIIHSFVRDGESCVYKVTLK